MQFRNNFRRGQPFPQLHIKKLPPDNPAFVNEIRRGARDLFIARVEDVIGSNRRFRLVGEQRVGYLEGFSRYTNRRWSIRADSNNLGTFGLDSFITGLQLTELRLTGASRAKAIEHQHHFLAEIIGEGVGVPIGIK